MSRETIAVDADDVLGAENEAMRLFINETYGQNHSPEDYEIKGEYWGYWEQVWGVDQEEAQRRYEAFIDSGVHAHLTVIEGAIDGIAELEKDYDLVVVTSRKDRFVDITHTWLSQHFPQLFKGVEFVHAWSGDKEANKAIICEGIGASYLIDDNLGHCTDVAEVGVIGILFGNYGWNKGKELPSGVIHIPTWQLVTDYFRHARTR